MVKQKSVREKRAQMSIFGLMGVSACFWLQAGLAQALPGGQASTVLNRSTQAKSAYPQTPTILSEKQPILKTNNPDWSWLQPRATGEVYGNAFFLDQNRGWVTISGGTGLLVTTNAGKTWSRQSFGPTYGLNDVFFSDPQRGWAVGNGSGKFDVDNDTSVIWATTDDGKSWYEQYHVTNPKGGGLSVVEFADGAGVGYSFGRHGLALKTLNGGLDWKELKVPQEVLDAEIDLLDAKVLSPDVVWVVGSKAAGQNTPSVNYVIKTFDGGETWFTYPIAAGKADMLEKIWAIDDIAFVAGQSPRIYRTTDGGTEWEAFEIAQPTIQPVVGLDFTNPYEGWIALGDGRVMSTVDSGRNWGLRSVMPQGRPTGLVFADALHGWVFANHGMMYTTSDGGLSWSYASSDNDNNLMATTFKGQQGWVVGEAGTILFSGDGGKNWKPQVSNSKQSLNAVSFLNHQQGVVVGDSGTLLRTQNGGKAWLPVSSVATEESLLSFDLTGVSMLSKSSIWITGTGVNHLLHTDNGGGTWTPTALPVEGYEWSDPFFIDQDHGWVLGSSEDEQLDGVLLITTNGGKSWTPKYPKFNESADKNILSSVCFVSPTEGWLAGGHIMGLDSVGGVLHTTDGGNTWTQQMAEETPISIWTVIRFSDKNNGIVSGPESNSNWITRDGGATWVPRIAFHTGRNLTWDIAFVNRKTAVAVGTGGAIMRSTNGGGTAGPFKPQFDPE